MRSADESSPPAQPPLTAKQQQQLERIMKLCRLPPGQRTQEDLWFIRDQLHTSCAFFRLWPSQLQSLLCSLAVAHTWGQHEVLAAPGSTPRDVVFILDGHADVAVRAAADSSELTAVGDLTRGDTCGELALLGAQRHPAAFVVVRSPKLLTLLVSAAQLADGIAALQHQAHQQRAPGTTTAAPPHQPRQDLSTDALYSLIGEPRGCSAGALSPEQLQHVQRLQAQQLQAAAAAEAATVGACGWRQPLPKAGAH